MFALTLASVSTATTYHAYRDENPSPHGCVTARDDAR